MNKYNFFCLFLLLTMSFGIEAQTITGNVSDKDFKIIGAEVSTDNVGTVTDIYGNYTLNFKNPGTYIVSVSYEGYSTVSKTFSLEKDELVTWDFLLESTIDEFKDLLNELVVVGTRTKPRTSLNTPLPIDVIKTEDLLSTGQNTFDKALQHRVPYFNTTQVPVNDATSLLDPYEIRNLGPSRTLVLINGKRKNMSALLYTQTSPGVGETATDISGFSLNSIKRIEILRDGASAQYGSDAIAGVMNIILKDDVDNSSISFNSGITGKGDGLNYGIALNHGSKLFKNGFLNFTADFSKSELANRAGTVDAQGEHDDFGGSIEDIEAFLEEKPDAGNINNASPETTAAKFVANMMAPISESTQVYGNAAYTYKKVNSFANYRTPYWRTLEEYDYLEDFFGNEFGYEDADTNGVMDYAGYLPTFDGELLDYNGTVGIDVEKNGWIIDGSFTIGKNRQLYTVRNSHNGNETLNIDGTYKYRENSPIQFNQGGTSFFHSVLNIDVSRRLSDKFELAFGSEYRAEEFTVIEGDLASYEDGGADSFSGNDSRNSGIFNRYNLGGYVGVAADLTEDFLINGTVRLEDYSDFGTAFVWKLSTRYKFLNDKITLRSSASTGFRAPTLHQIYSQKSQYNFVAGEGIQLTGFVSNVSREARLLNLPFLEPERSQNFTFGIGIRPVKGLSIAVDYYNIIVRDRIALSAEIKGTFAGRSSLDEILEENNIKEIQFFANALDTRTQGIDFVVNFAGFNLGKGLLGANFSANYTIQNERRGDIKNPEIIQEAKQEVLNETQESLFFTSRPKYKSILGLHYNIKKFHVFLNNTLFGPTIFNQQGLDPNLYTRFKTKVVTDLGVSYNITDRISMAVNINNIFNVLPEWEFKAENEAGELILNDEALLKEQSNLITFNQRYSQLTYDGYHFSQLGTLFNLSLTVGL